MSLVIGSFSAKPRRLVNIACSQHEIIKVKLGKNNNNRTNKLVLSSVSLNFDGFPKQTRYTKLIIFDDWVTSALDNDHSSLQIKFDCIA